MKLKDKVAVITGAAQGIGAAFAVGYAKEGAKIVIADILDGKDAVAAVKQAGSEAVYVKTDVTVQAECDAMAKTAVERFGGIHILVNNAAIFGDLVMKPFIEISDEEWNRVMNVNVGGPFRSTKAVFPYKIRGEKSSICVRRLFLRESPSYRTMCHPKGRSWPLHGPWQGSWGITISM